jgi:hypothetical protein
VFVKSSASQVAALLFFIVETNEMNKKAQLELYFWLFTIIVAIAVLLPMITRLPDYPFFFVNTVYVIVAITMTRYLFLLKHTFLAKQQRLKVIVFFLFIPLVFYMVQKLNYFQTFLDERGPEAVVGALPLSSQDNMLTYIRSEMILFGVASIISTAALGFRLLISVWRLRNRGKV